ncbi:hypothetical protein BFW01_g3927 [Lasiodiplodia theobromae]|uniref:Lysophospholipid acyltransferase n=1 Tax=Lasiodiplodia theobromae TaxID=45133 RepID=A0A8H7MCJ5_9PEZI|nr:hypothetical protein BFW01_g3927 [Lasiodiplodia theobromae]
MRYYGLWSFTEGACVLSGLGYNGVDMVTGRVKWDRMKNARPFELEFAQAADSYVRNWNVRTHTWLRDYVYVRCLGLGSRFLPRMISFIVSAMWHGFNPAHYLSFAAAAIIQTIAKGARRQIRPVFLDRQGDPARTKKYYDVLTWLLTQLTVAFIFVPFIFPDFGTSVVVWKRTMGIP